MFLLCTLSGRNAESAVKVQPPGNLFPVYNFEYDWLTYNSQYKNYVPFSQGVNEESKSVSVYVDLLKNRKYVLLLQTRNEGYLFIEGTLQQKLTSDKWVELSVDSLYKIYRKGDILLTVYGNPGIEDKTLLVCNKGTSNAGELAKSGSSGLINIKPINFSSFGNLIVLSALLILIVSSWVYNADPLSFIRFVNPIEFFNNEPRDQLSKVNKPYSINVVFIVVASAMLMSGVLVFLRTERINLFSINSILSEENNTLHFLQDFFLLSILFFLFIYGKYILMALVGNVLNLDKIVDVVFLKIVQSSYLFHALLFVLVFVLTFNHSHWMELWRPYILLPFLIFYSVRFIALYVVVKPSGTIINLYLFSYLCVIEVIPLIIGAKFAL